MRLRWLGFTRVEALPWWQSPRRRRRRSTGACRLADGAGDSDVAARGQLELFNIGNTYVLRAKGLSAAFFADAGDDFRGSMGEVCRRVRRDGAVDLLFTGIRGLQRCSLHFRLLRTLAPFLVNVPQRLLAVPQSLMATAEDALQWGDLLGARHVVPCADGGAPWYWREGMGPRYPGFPGQPVEGASALDENPDADPFPERLIEVAAKKATSAAADPSGPGDAWWNAVFQLASAALLGLRWPFAPQPFSQTAPAKR